MVGTMNGSPVEPGGRQNAPAEKASSAHVGDVALIVAITRRDGDALGEVYRRYSAPLHGRARRLCGPDRAEEVLQEVFLELWRKPERYDFTRSSLLSYLMMQVYGRAVDRLRSDGARRSREATVARRGFAPGVNVESDVLTRMAGDEVCRLLSALPDDERDAIALAYFEGHTYRAVAGLLGQPEGTIKSRIRSGLTRLRVEIADDDPPMAGSPTGAGRASRWTVDPSASGPEGRVTTSSSAG